MTKFLLSKGKEDQTDVEAPHEPQGDSQMQTEGLSRNLEVRGWDPRDAPSS